MKSRNISSQPKKVARNTNASKIKATKKNIGENKEGLQLDDQQLLEVLLSLKKGNISKRMPSNLTGIDGKIADTLNDIMDDHELMMQEFEHVSKTIGKDGKLSERITGGGYTGTWASMVKSVNNLIDDLAWPTTEMARVIGAVAKGDLTQKMEVKRDDEPLKGDFLRSSKVVNTMVNQLGSFASEVTRVAREVGTDGKLGGQAKVKGVSGTWKDLTDNVNQLAGNLTDQVRNIAEVTTAVAKGDMTKKITVNVKGEIQELKETINTMVDQLSSFASEVTRVAREVGTEGRLGGQADVPGVSGIWKNLTDNVNLMADNLTDQMRNIADVTTAVAKGDLSKKITVNVKGEIQELKKTINTMVDQLGSFASEVTRVARDVGTEGKLGGQANVPGVSGTWKDLTDNVNLMADNLTDQVRSIAEVTTAVAEGDLSKKITVSVKGEIQELKKTINTMVDQLSSFASEVTRVARDVGTEGKLGGQANVPGVSGTWKDLTDNVNLMADNLTDQVRSIDEVIAAVAKGDLSKKITVTVKGEIQALKKTINTMVDQLSSFASEVTRVAREVGTEGELGGQADVPGVSGTWKDLTDNVNHLAGNLTVQLRDVSKVATAIAQGDLSRKITVDAQGEILEIKETINNMIDILATFADQVTTVAREVGTEGKLGGQAEVQGVSGTWKDLTDNVNLMAINLTDQVRNIAEVTTAVAKGDLSKKITVDVKGEIQQLKETINTMVDQLSSFASEVTRVAREVGTEGKLGGQAKVSGVSGTWGDLTDNVNLMANKLTDQVRGIAEVTTAVARGDLSKKISVDAQGEIQELKETINTMVDQLSSFASEVTRVAREVGTEGKLGGQADVPGVSGTWEDLTDNVNLMAINLTDQVRNIAEVTTAVAKGDLSKKITVDVKGEIQQLKRTINTMVDQLGSFASEVTRVAREVGTDGKLGGQADVPGVSGTWKDLTDNVNQLAGNLTVQLRDVSKVATAIAHGDLSKKITVDVKGEILQIKETINTMVDQLGSFASEVTRVAREVGTEGKLGGQAKVSGVSGTWKDLTDNVNMMANNLTDQVRGIAKIVTAVANGDLKKKLLVEAKGEIASLAETINNMIDTLAIFASQVTSVAREVGTEGKLGGQAEVPGVSGTWEDLTNNVNQLADNLTTQVRAIADVATAVTDGDLTRSITVLASGEVEELKNNINEMIRNLRETTLKNKEQDWLKTNLAKFTRMLQGQRDLLEVSRILLSELALVVSAQHGVFYGLEQQEDNQPILKLLSSYGHKDSSYLPREFAIGEGLIGQCAIEKERILISRVPEDYIKISSGLGEAPPANIVVLPVVFEGQVKAVIELASFNHFSETHLSFLEQLTESIGIVFNTIEASMRTETLLAQSQSLAGELQNQQEELQQTNEELEEKAHLLAEQKTEVENKNNEVEYAKKALEEKAAQLQLTSRYKSEFLANMSHELRTPLNSLLILSEQLKDNPSENLDSKQVEFAETIHAAGSDLLNLINDILDLSKIESGTVTVDLNEVRFDTIKELLERMFFYMADTKKGLDFKIDIKKNLPQSIHSDANRLLQILKNLISNAFKFTESGKVELKVYKAESGWDKEIEALNQAESVIAFSVTDTGIGINPDKQKIIFEAFQQADGSTNRRYGGTGLGLAISREIAQLLNGQLQLTKSIPGEGSIFTVYIPQLYKAISKVTSGEKVDEPKENIIEEPGELKSSILTHLEVGPFEDDRDHITEEDPVILIIEEDQKRATSMLKAVRSLSYKGLVAASGKSGLTLAREVLPKAIIINNKLKDIKGWSMLDRIKLDSKTRQIPVCMIANKEDVPFALRQGAYSCISTPNSKKQLDKTLEELDNFVSRRNRHLLLIEDKKQQENSVSEQLSDEDWEITKVSVENIILNKLTKKIYDCVVIEPGVKETSVFELLENIESSGDTEVPIILYTNGKISKKNESYLVTLKEKLVLKTVNNPQSLLYETCLFMHKPTNQLPANKQKMLKDFNNAREVLAGKNVLVVDDDIRNIFAITSVLERQNMNVITAENGKEALSILENQQTLDVILLDIMMPEMDGYETLRIIRKNPLYKSLPILTLTAKAMKEDRINCFKAGASDYITKPVNTYQLLSLLSVWLHE
ncbi:MAG: HAMP domain-containing protein [Balneolales bacterium]